MEVLIKKYVERFDENFPLFMLGSMSDDEIKALIEDCLAKGEPYRPEDNVDVVY